MHSAAVSLSRTPVIGGSSAPTTSDQSWPPSHNRTLKRQASLSRFSRDSLRPLRVQAHSAAAITACDNGLKTVKTTLDNLAKMFPNTTNPEAKPVSKPVEKIISEHRSLLQSNESALYSPRQKLGNRWREFHGCNDWEGLLDPLDENLRREIVKYGDFVQAAYNAMDFDPLSSQYGLCKFSDESSVLENAGLHGTGYRVTKHLYATSAVKVPEWASDRLTHNATRVLRRRSWVGYVGVCEDQKEIERLGRRDIVISLRGTVTPLEWTENLKSSLTTLKDKDSNGDSVKVSSGFWRLFTSKLDGDSPHSHSMADDIVHEVKRLISKYEGEEISITVTGHSLGAALSVLTAYEIGKALGLKKDKYQSPTVTVFSFGGPRVGNRQLAMKMEEMGCHVLRIVNCNDVVTKVPGVMLNEKNLQQSDNVKKYAGKSCYWHVGKELSVKTKSSPYLKPDAEKDMNCCHDLEAYLHLVDGYLSSQCPFRSTAKRDIIKLLMNQKSNVLLKPSLSMKGLFDNKDLKKSLSMKGLFEKKDSMPRTPCTDTVITSSS